MKQVLTHTVQSVTVHTRVAKAIEWLRVLDVLTHARLLSTVLQQLRVTTNKCTGAQQVASLWVLVEFRDLYRMNHCPSRDGIKASELKPSAPKPKTACTRPPFLSAVHVSPLGAGAVACVSVACVE